MSGHKYSGSLISYGQITPLDNDSHFTKRNKNYVIVNINTFNILGDKRKHTVSGICIICTCI